MISQSYRVYESEVCGPEAGFQVQVTSSLRLGVRRGLARFLATLSRLQVAGRLGRVIEVMGFERAAAFKV